MSVERLSVMTTLSEVLTFILDAEPNEIDIIRNYIKDRAQSDKTAKRQKAFAALKVGDRIKIGSNVRPKYLAGATGTVTKKNVTRVIVDFDVPHNRFYRGVTCPPEMLELA